MSSSLTSAPVPKVLKQIAIPASIGFLFNTLFNITDTFFVQGLGDTAIAALTYAFPLFFLLIAFGSGFGQGAGAIVANLLGAGEKRKAFKAAKQTLFLTVGFGILIAIVGPLLAPYVVGLFPDSSSEAQALTLQYITPMFFMSIFFILPMMMNSILMAQGNSRPMRDVMMIGFFLNLILNPALMNGWGALPTLGIQGIAWATIIVEIIATLYTAYHLSKSELFSQIPDPENKPHNFIPEVLSQGLAPAMNLAFISIGAFFITYALGRYGEDAVTGYGIGTRLIQFFFLPVIGINMAVINVVGQNFGAQKFTRIREIYNTALKYAFYVSAFGGISIALFATFLASFFSQDPAVLAFATKAMVYESFAFFGYSLIFISVAVWQGIKKPQIGFWANLIRQAIFPYIVFVHVFAIITPSIDTFWVMLIVMNMVFGGGLWFLTNRKIKTLEK